jgi:hypothetical protein
LAGIASTLDHATETIDDLALERLDVLKLQAGCSISEVISGAEATIWRLRPALFIALECGEPIEPAVERLTVLGYRCWSIASATYPAGRFFQLESRAGQGGLAPAIVGIPEERDPPQGLGQYPEYTSRRAA